LTDENSHGWIEIICGCMFSGKTEELIRRLRRVMYARRNFQVFKPSKDNRYAEEEVVTHLKDRLPCTTVPSAAAILELVHSDTEVVGIDEVQFFDSDIIKVVNDLANRGVRVITAGLDRDSMNQSFGPMAELLVTAEKVDKLAAVCMVCGKNAHFSQVLTEKDGVLLIGGAGVYEARCRKHFTPA